MAVVKMMLDADKLKMFAHFQTLSNEDLQLRFGSTSLTAVENYIKNIHPSDIIFVIEEGGEYVAVSHIAKCDKDSAELAISVSPKHRGKHYASKIFEEAISYLKTRGIKKVFVNCFSSNRAIQHLAKQHGFSVFTAYGWTEGELDLSGEIPSTQDLLTFVKKNEAAVIDISLRTVYEMCANMLTLMSETFNKNVKKG